MLPIETIQLTLQLTDDDDEDDGGDGFRCRVCRADDVCFSPPKPDPSRLDGAIELRSIYAYHVKHYTHTRTHTLSGQML